MSQEILALAMMIMAGVTMNGSTALLVEVACIAKDTQVDHDLASLKNGAKISDSNIFKTIKTVFDLDKRCHVLSDT